MNHFSREEFKTRLRRTKEKMDKAGLEVLLLSHPANMNYITGYDGWSFYVPQGVIIFIDKEEPVWYGRQQDSNGARLTTWLSEENIQGYEDDYVQSQIKHPASFAGGLIAAEKPGCVNIGVEMDSYYFNPRSLQVLQKTLPNASITDATRLVPRVRQIKSDQEISYIKDAARIAENVMQTAIDNIAPGVREGDAAAEVYHAQISGTEDFTGDYPAIAPIMPSGKRTSTAHLTWTDREYEKDEVVLLELAGCRYKYNCPLSRTVYLGEPPQKLKDVAKTVIAGVQETLDFIEPGVTCEEVEAAWRQSISGSRVVKKSRVGYSFGLNYPPDWGEQTASLRPGDKTILKPNMTFHFMPGIWLDDFGFENSEPIKITEEGCECFVDFPRKLFTVK